MRLFRRTDREHQRQRGELTATVDALQKQLEQAVDATVARRSQGSDEVALSETVIAVRTAQALERITGQGWDETLGEQVERFQQQG